MARRSNELPGRLARRTAKGETTPAGREAICLLIIQLYDAIFHGIRITVEFR
jgi:hypothetical protein